MMKAFTQFIKENKVIKKSPDPAEARSLVTQAKERLADLKVLPLNKKNASFRFESAYEVLRELLQAFLAAEGYKPYSHEAIFSFASERKLLPESKAMQADRYREIRNDINYRGKKVTVMEAKEIMYFVKQNFGAVKKKFESNLVDK